MYHEVIRGDTTAFGLQATNGLRQTEKAFEVLYSRLKAREVHNEITTCLTMIIQALVDRHYQRANEVYLQLSIGNQQWPIGVTSIGIHDRTAREKLSYYSNTKSQAHIMNDEATRKYLHGISRLIAAVQRLHPADPSRSYNFNAVEVRACSSCLNVLTDEHSYMWCYAACSWSVLAWSLGANVVV